MRFAQCQICGYRIYSRDSNEITDLVIIHEVQEHEEKEKVIP